MCTWENLIMRKTLRYERIFLPCWMLSTLLFGVVVWYFGSASHEDFSMGDHVHQKSSVFKYMESTIYLSDKKAATTTQTNCTFWDCLDTYKCIENDKGKVSVYVYNVQNYFFSGSDIPANPKPTKEFVEMISAIVSSPYYVNDPSIACLFIPPVDLINRERFNGNNIANLLAGLPHWNEGTNHILFNMVPGIAPEYHTTLDLPRGKAIVAGSGFSHRTYRRTFDVSIPLYNPTQKYADFIASGNKDRPFLLVSSQTGIYKHTLDLLNDLSLQRSDVVILNKCVQGNYSYRCDTEGIMHPYPSVLTKSKFCLITRSRRLATTTLHDVLRAGCVPVIAMDGYVMPFTEVLDWKRAALFVNEYRLSKILTYLDELVNDHNALQSMQTQVKFYYEQYFSSMANIALTTLDVINDRILHYRAKTYNYWNSPAVPKSPKNPFFVPLQPSDKQGFTAVILTYDRVELMLQVVANIAKAKSVAKIIIVWNNQQEDPSESIKWPKISVPIKVIRTKFNHLSNRFYPFKEIETDCVLSIDDDINMVPPEELEFGFRVWREFPDRLVGFPPRVHSYNNSEWKYESEWMSNISMVLTGVAFYHKYYHYLYESSLPDGIKKWVDENMNCEDIAMNFLITNVTGKAPIKLLARKKFRVSAVNLSSNLQSHMVARNVCMKRFVDGFGDMPLKTVEFRADPVLYREEGYYDELKTYKVDGSL